MDDTIKIVGSLEKLYLLIDDASETVKYEIEKQKDVFLPVMMAPMIASLISPMASSLMQSVAFSLINAIIGKGVMRAEKGQEGRFLVLLVLTFWANEVKSRNMI